MDMGQFKSIAGNRNFIEGIYNYCDRWCERCSFQNRCMLYAMELKSRNDESSAPDPENTASEISRSLQSAIDLLQAIAVENHLELPQELTNPEKLGPVFRPCANSHKSGSQAESRMSRLDQLSSDLPPKDRSLLRIAYQYAHLVREWFDAYASVFETKQGDWDRRLVRGEAESSLNAELTAIQEAIANISWYQRQIFVKLARAHHSRNWAEHGAPHAKQDDESDRDAYRQDSDGSAKVALIGIDRSLNAWSTLSETLSTDSDGILVVTETLRQLRSSVQEMFPKAWQFIRPGFDDSSAVLD